jgi:uncharacterized protein YdhG (YjbR/CyaY superfamily)
MTAAEVDAYLSQFDGSQRSTLERLRRSILRAAPDAEQGISYAVPAFRENGRVVAGFAGFSKHNAYLPHSGSVFGRVESELGGYERTASSLHFALDESLPDELVAHLVQAKRDVLGHRS